jgi:hypothetical protein
MSDELERISNDQLELIGQALVTQSSGTYYIPEVSLVEISSEKVSLLNWLLTRLVQKYPEFIWQQTESWSQPGILISWRRKPEGYISF